MHKIPAHMCSHWSLMNKLHIQVPDYSWGVCASTPTGMHLTTSACPECRVLCMLTHRACTCMCTLTACPWIFIFWKEKGRVNVSWDYVHGRCQETPASGFHITILSLIEIFVIISFSVGFQIPKLLEHIGDMYLSTSSAETWVFLGWAWVFSGALLNGF